MDPYSPAAALKIDRSCQENEKKGRFDGGYSLDVFSLLSGLKLVLDFGFLDERVENVENRVARPDLGRQRESEWRIYILRWNEGERTCPDSARIAFSSSVFPATLLRQRANEVYW